MIVLQNDISQYSEILVTKLNSHNEVMTKLEESVKESADTTAELGSNLQILKSSLESLREEQEREQNLLAEALKLLSTLASEHSAKPGPQRVMDRSIQTLPELEQSASSILQNKELEGTALTCTPENNLEHKQAEAPPQDRSCSIGKRKSRSQRKRTKKAQTLSQRSKRKVSEENSPSLINCKKVQNLLAPRSKRCDLKRKTSQDNTECLSVLCRETRSSKAAGCLLTPLSCWSQDSNSSACLAGIKPILEKSDETKTAIPGKGFWQLFDIDCSSDFGF
ncbi:uncharacterized protein LOC133967793 [Platichthys flesus]|uniref:uncharacterized protein LOC133967793 n=1 Tax=Platichthys flesus TaxID=8260 RepID=UPI002DBA1258|nr:uncharacterized protein LOC133967793 [Platichthys flesus]